MQPTPNELAQLAQLAQSPTGQALMALLQQQGGDRLNEAMTQAAAGDYAQAKNALSSVLSTPEAQALLRQLEEQL